MERKISSQGLRKFSRQWKTISNARMKELLEVRKQLKRKEMELEILIKAVSIITKDNC
ncbi:hypothetical protein [Paludibacter sp.]|uniref:hypothetical protein n=1 Tax=Paludibacter sp. TaxID=1898105 RepID=UPI0025F2B547|nr:hypothetical protein [Paludibacter sp.]